MRSARRKSRSLRTCRNCGRASLCKSPVPPCDGKRKGLSGGRYSGVGVPTSVDGLLVSGQRRWPPGRGCVSSGASSPEAGFPRNRPDSPDTGEADVSFQWMLDVAPRSPGFCGGGRRAVLTGAVAPQVLRDGAVPGRREEEGAPAAVPPALPPVPCGECACGCSPVTRWHRGPYLGAAPGSHPTGCMWGPHEWRVLQPDPPRSRVPGVPFSTG